MSLPEGMGVSREAEFASEIGLAMEVYGWENQRNEATFNRKGPIDYYDMMKSEEKRRR